MLAAGVIVLDVKHVMYLASPMTVIPVLTLCILEQFYVASAHVTPVIDALALQVQSLLLV